MIKRRPFPKDGAWMDVQKFAWLPVHFNYHNEHITIWLEKYVEQQLWRHSSVKCHHSAYGRPHLCESRRLTVPDALLEKLNSEPDPDPDPPRAPTAPAQLSVISQAVLHQAMLQHGNAALGGLGGLTPGVMYQQKKAQP